MQAAPLQPLRFMPAPLKERIQAARGHQAQQEQHRRRDLHFTPVPGVNHLLRPDKPAFNQFVVIDAGNLVFRAAYVHEPGIETDREKRRRGNAEQRSDQWKPCAGLRQEIPPLFRRFLYLLLQRLFPLPAEFSAQGSGEDVRFLQGFSHRAAFQHKFFGVVLPVIVDRADVAAGEHPVSAEELEFGGAPDQVHLGVFVRPTDKDNAGG